MQIIINIPKEDYDSIKYNTNRTGSDYLILNGKILPAGHGRLIDADDIDNHIIGHVDTRSCPTIVKADGGDVE